MGTVMEDPHLIPGFKIVSTPEESLTSNSKFANFLRGLNNVVRRHLFPLAHLISLGSIGNLFLGSKISDGLLKYQENHLELLFLLAPGDSLPNISIGFDVDKGLASYDS